MGMEVLVNDQQRDKRSLRRPSGGWLMLQRRLQETIHLAPADNPQHEARITLRSTQPLTLELDLAGVGVLEICLHPQQNGVKFGIRADASVRVTREELTLP